MPRKSIEEQLDEKRQGRPEREPVEREPLSWRERDRRRESGDPADRGRSNEVPRAADRYASAQAQKALKGELQGLFRDAQGDALRDAVLAAERAGLDAALDALIAERGKLPRHVELLDKAMESRRDSTLRLVIDALDELLPEADPAARTLLLTRLRAKGRRSFDAVVARRSKELLARWGIED